MNVSRASTWQKNSGGVVCPDEAIYDNDGNLCEMLKPAQRPKAYVDLQSCVGCEWCVWACPFDALVMGKTPGAGPHDHPRGHAQEKKFPKGPDVFLFKFQGLFYVAPAQDSFMCRLRLPCGIISSHQLRGVAGLAGSGGQRAGSGGHSKDGGGVRHRVRLRCRERPDASEFRPVAPFVTSLTRRTERGLNPLVVTHMGEAR